MNFQFTTEEARKQALAVARHFKRLAAEVDAETPFSEDAPYTTNLYIAQDNSIILVDAQPQLIYHAEVQALARWLAARRENVELYLAAPEDSVVQAGSIDSMRGDGVGLLLIDSKSRIRISHPARNPARTIHVEPTLRLGRCEGEVRAAIQKYNRVDRADGFRDLCDIVERETDRLIRLEERKGGLTMGVAEIDRMDWAGQINTLASDKAHNKKRLVSDSLKDDLHSFRNSRNLFKHPVKSYREADDRERQLMDKTLLGARLVHELLTVMRRVK